MELELKFILGPEAIERWKARLAESGAQRERFRALYFDTADRRLSKGHIALRLRREGRRWVQTLKASGSGAIDRLEDEVEVVFAGRGVPSLDLSRHAGTPAGERLLEALGDAAALLSVRFETDFWRTRRLMANATGTEVEVALDIGHVMAGSSKGVIAELELEHKSGATGGLFEMAGQAVAEGGLWLSTISKAERGVRLSERKMSAQAVKAKRLVLPKAAQDVAFLRRVLKNTLDQILPNASAVVAGDSPAEVIHQLRVGLRRMRTALRELGQGDNGVQASWDAPLASTFARLGESRDDEAVGQVLRPLLVRAGAPRVTWTASNHVNAQSTQTAVQDPAFQQALIGTLGFAYAAEERHTALSHAALREQLARRLNRLHRRIVADGKRFEQLPIDQQHGVRKRLKRLRYLSEFAGSLWNPKSVETYLDALEPAQEALGLHNDTAVGAEKFREEAVHHPDAGFAADFLRAHLTSTARESHQALKAVRGARRFWRE